ncbi:MAG: histidine--tRNA ligase [Desulfobacterota bacterium]|nr:histidine--tRNA ligase [Thermodesulfobacteriota bacterium]
MLTPQIPKGFRDFLPEKMALRQRVIRNMVEVFERFGFQPLDTPCLEYAETLEGKYGEEGDKLIYKFQDRGSRMVALRYDLTIPLCRVIAMHPELTKPFKRYHIAPVWRADKPQKGRFREFYQCDIDIIGTDSMYADAELLIITHEVLARLGFSNFCIRINNRKLLNSLARAAGLDNRQIPAFLRSLDKLDKVGIDAVREELRSKNLLHNRLEACLSAIVSMNDAPPHRFFETFAALLHTVPAEDVGLRELETIRCVLEAYGIPESRYRFDPTLARGLDYYTGPIFETVVTEPQIGSITGGGRYDNLIGMFTGTSIPATGSSFGLERIITVMEELGTGIQTSAGAQVLVTLFDTGQADISIRIAKMLRDAGIRTEFYFSPDKLKKQLTYASNRRIPFVVIIGPDEARDNTVTLRNMQNGSQTVVSQHTLPAVLRDNLSQP